MQPPSIPVPLKGKIGKDITASGYAKNVAGKWTWSSNPQDSLQRSKSLASLDTTHAAPSVTHPAKDLKVIHAATAKKQNFVGAEFKNAGQVGLDVWRMENMTAKPIPKEQHGKFYTGDAYIVLNVTSEKSSSYHIHFWIGKESSQDKYGTAAYKTVELDNKFTGSAIHHREEQGKESDLFKSYFKDGIEYLTGGTASSFKHVQREVFAKRLLHLKGRRSVRVKQVEATYKSLNTGDVFVLDVGRTIFQWNGPHASRTERVKGVEVIRNIKDNERGGRATIIVVEHSTDEKLNQNKKAEQFWEALGEKGPIAEADSAGDDDEFEKQITAETVLHKIFVERDQVKTEIITTRPLKKEMLDPHNAYVLDANTEVFAWIGKSNSANQKNFVNDFAKKIHSEKVSWAPFVKIVQGAETPMFKEKFDNWKQLFPKNLDYGVSAQLLPSFTKRTEYPKEEVDVEKLITTKAKPRPENALLHAGTGVLKIWKIEDFKKVEIPETQHGIFFSKSCYICLYVEVKDQRRSHYIYFWQGRHSSKENKGTSALLAKEMADSIRGKQQQFRVVHNKEPEHFVMLFKGKMIIGLGEHPKTREDLGGLYHIKFHPNNWEWHIKAAQVPMACESLNSNDVFVMVASDRKCFVWVGIGSSSWERKVAKLVAARLVGDANVGKITTIDEGKEVAFFWPYFPGGKKEYANAEYLKWNSKSPRLFHCSNTTGTFKVEEIFNFTQEDLDKDDPFILDCYAEVYVWVGTGSNEIEKKFAMQTALEYVTKAAAIDERDPSTPIYYVTPGEEPLQFKCHFLAWDNDLIADTKQEDEDDGLPLKSSIVFKASYNPEPQKPLYPALKAAPAPDPNRPKISFSFPVDKTAQPAAEKENKDTKAESRPPLSFSYPKSSSTDPTTSAPTTPRGTVIYPKPAATTPPANLKTSSDGVAKPQTTSIRVSAEIAKPPATALKGSTEGLPKNPLKGSDGVPASTTPLQVSADKVPPPVSAKVPSESVPAAPQDTKESAANPSEIVTAPSEPTASTPAPVAHVAESASAGVPVSTSEAAPLDSAPIATPTSSEPTASVAQDDSISASVTPAVDASETSSPSVSAVSEPASESALPVASEPKESVETAAALEENPVVEKSATKEESLAAEQLVSLPAAVPTAESAPQSTPVPKQASTQTSVTTPSIAVVGESKSSEGAHSPTLASKPTPTKPLLSINLGSLSGSQPSTSTPSSSSTSTPSTDESSGPITPGRAARPPWIKTRAENAKIIATLTPTAKPTLTSTGPVVVAVLSPRSSTPTSSSSVISATISKPSSTLSTPMAAAVSAAIIHGGSTAAIASAASVAAAASITAAISITSPTSTSPATTTTTTTTSSTVEKTEKPEKAEKSEKSEKPAEAEKPEPKKNAAGFQIINIKTKPLGLVQVELAKYNREFYSFEELTARKKPPGVDVTCLEKYLVDEEFEKIFGMSKEKFYQIPVWKRVTLRKDKKLY